ncbi:MAG TPA: SRPBCC family protein [Alphaproteobacteria bacterium]
MSFLPDRTITISIDRPYQDVYNFLAEPENFPLWAEGLGRLDFIYGDWIVQTPQGPMSIRFTIRNSFGIVDHYITVPDGKEIYVPMRVIESGEGAQVIFTLFHRPDMTFEQFENDIQLVEKDLYKLKTTLEEKHDR